MINQLIINFHLIAIIYLVPGQCMYDSELKSASITSYDQVDNDIDTIMEAMASKGPLAMSLYVNDNWRYFFWITHPTIDSWVHYPKEIIN